MTTPITDFKSMDSSAIRTVYYDADTSNLYVRFHSNQVAGYTGCSQALFNEFKNAPSAGSFYSAYVKPALRGIDTSGFEPRLREVKATPEPKVDAVQLAVPADQQYEVVYQTVETSVVSASSFDEAAERVKDGSDTIKILAVRLA